MNDVQKKKLKKVLGIVGNTLLWLFVAFSCLLTVLVFAAQGSDDGVPELFGKSMITIQSPSMSGTFEIGDMVIVTKIDEEQRANLKVGDIVTYRAPIDINGDDLIGDLNTHRIYSIEGAVITTKGDNNALTDAEDEKNPYTIVANDIVGVCTESGKISGLGNVLDFLRSPTGFFICVVLPLVLFFLYELYNFISLLVTERAKKASAAGAAVSKETEEEIKRRAIEEYLKQQAVEEYIKQQQAQNAPADAPSENSNSENNAE